MLILTLYLNNMYFSIQNTFLDKAVMIFPLFNAMEFTRGNLVYITDFIRLKRTLVMTDVQ